LLPQPFPIWPNQEVAVSEYQYYKFQALDRPLTDADRAFLHSLSSRAEVTPTTAAFTYSYGDFRGEPAQVVERCFDAMLYLANWGTKQLMFRLPQALVNLADFDAYYFPDIISTTITSDYVILDITFEEEPLGWLEGGDWLERLAPLRDDLLNGDFRLLYLAWLKATQIAIDETEEDPLEPPVPPNLQNLSPALQAFLELVDIDPALLRAAAQASETHTQYAEPLEQSIAKLTPAEINAFLVRIAKGEPHVDLLIRGRLKELAFGQRSVMATSGTPRRLLSQLLELAKRQPQKVH
jgi:hypothetical protein